MHPITALQGTLLAALDADAALTAALGNGRVFDAPPRGQSAPYVALVRHDVLPHDTDLVPGNEHRLVAHVWHADPSRKAVLDIAERIAAVALAADLDGAGLVVTGRALTRTETVIDPDTGQARAALAFRFLTEPAG